MNRNGSIIHTSLLFRFYVTTRNPHRSVDATCARYISVNIMKILFSKGVLGISKNVNFFGT